MNGQQTNTCKQVKSLFHIYCNHFLVVQVSQLQLLIIINTQNQSLLTHTLNIMIYKGQYYEGSLSSRARTNFVTKVFSIVGIQLLVTTFFVGVNMNYPKIAQFQLESTLLFWISVIGSLVSAIVLSFSQEQSKTFPNNMCWLGLFTLCESHLVSVTTSFYTAETVFLCALATVAATLGLTLYALTTKSDFTSLGNSVTAFGLALFNVIFWVCLINIFFIRSPIINIFISVALAVIYMIYLLIDIQLVMGGKRNNLTMDNYVMGAMIIYVDIVRLFLNILRILGKKKND